MIRKLIFAASMAALALATPAQAQRAAYSITCPEYSDSIFTIDPANGTYVETDDIDTVHILTDTDRIVLAQHLSEGGSAWGTWNSEVIYIDLNDLAVYSDYWTVVYSETVVLSICRVIEV